MVIYSLEDLSLREIMALRKSLDHLPITGIDALFVGTLQLKLNEQIKQIEAHLQLEKTQKDQSLEEAINQDTSKSKKTNQVK